MVGLAVACDDRPLPPVRDAEVEALRNARLAGVAVAPRLQPPVHMVSPDQIGRCRVDERHGIRFEPSYDARALERQLAFRRALVSAWADDAQLVRLEVGCDPELLVIDLGTTWYSPGLGRLLHGEDPDDAIAVERRAPRAEVEAGEVIEALAKRAGAWGPALVVRSSPG